MVAPGVAVVFDEALRSARLTAPTRRRRNRSVGFAKVLSRTARRVVLPS